MAPARGGDQNSSEYPPIPSPTQKPWSHATSAIFAGGDGAAGDGAAVCASASRAMAQKRAKWVLTMVAFRIRGGTYNAP